jgi:hypothetical protein
MHLFAEIAGVSLAVVLGLLLVAIVVRVACILGSEEGID